LLCHKTQGVLSRSANGAASTHPAFGVVPRPRSDETGPGRAARPAAASTSPPAVVPTAPPSTAIGRVEQLVLRGDGLTTTSIEILTGHEVTVRVRRQWRFPLPTPSAPAGEPIDGFAGLGLGDADAYAGVGFADLDAEAGDDMLIRDVVLIGDNDVTYGTATVYAVVNRLPEEVAHRLATTTDPIGKLLVRAGEPVRRELRHWGLLRAGDFAAHLGPGIRPGSRVPARTYRMVNMLTQRPVTMITEWFAPRLFG
jgi:hypothetical protein